MCALGWTLGKPPDEPDELPERCRMPPMSGLARRPQARTWRLVPDAAWALLTNVRFAVVQIGVLAVAGLIGTLVPQVPAFALRSPAAHSRAIADLHFRYDPLTFLGWNVGPALTDVFERLGLFRVFSTPWFVALVTILAASVVACTLNRLPRLFREVRDVRIVQPEPFFHPDLPRRAVVGGAVPDERGRGGEGALEPAPVREELNRRRYRVSGAEVEGVTYLYGDRNRYQKLATLLTHAGLVLFLLGGAVTGALGYETGVLLADGQVAPIAPVGTQDNLIVKSLGFAAPRNPDGSFADFYSDIAVYRDGREVARKRIRVNDPLTVDGFTFHQNSFGPAAELEIRDAAGKLLWLGPVALDQPTLGLPGGTLTIPGSRTGLQVVLQRDAGAPYLALVGYRSVSGTSSVDVAFLGRLPGGVFSDPQQFGGFRIRWSGISSWTGLIVKKDPGAPIVWIAFLCLISGLTITFYFPRRRVWARLEGGRLQLAVRADRYVDVRAELAELVAAIGHRASGPQVSR